MNEYTLKVTVEASHSDALRLTQDALTAAGFGVLTQIDIQATLRAKLGVELPAQVILGACRPQLAHQALMADPRIATLLPCNVVVAEEPDGRTRIEVFDPITMTLLNDDPDVAAVATEARQRLSEMMASLTAPVKEAP